MDKYNPKVATYMSIIGCGAGQLYNQQILKGISFVLVGTYFNLKANLNEAILYSFLADIHIAHEILNYEWGMNYLSAFYFSMWDAYYNAYKNSYSAPPRSTTAIPFITAVIFGDLGIFYNHLIYIGPIFGGIVGSLIGVLIGKIIERFIKTGIFHRRTGEVQE
ncbi:hypothetical protein [Pontibacillus marinus]|uniref:Uncharacterized protein n=1 Tax=Pontibacillus marinus BH030004 = DSM 16465 TaxID=1385511 RepID=A0A0A5HLV9_9BACI|nr:hypothetical protein [Pontibacillus marinus]KGX84607.1 hypothetical protein N783_16560 [Pontibacillus marinus BH030004 = DSM 16465]